LLSWTEWLDGLAKSEALQAEARLIRAELQRLAETSARRKLTIAIASAITITLIAAAVLLIQRKKSRQQQDTLRTRIARDLHDEIGASLSHLAMQGDLARQQLQRAELSPDRLEKISASARETLDQMRDIIWLLAPKEGDWQELSHRMEAIARRLLEGIAHQITHQGKPPEGRPAIEYTRDILAFLKEALTNARKHASATEVRVSFDWSGPLVITIEDNGQGFDLTEAQKRGGSGLDNLQTRAAAMNATCEIQSTVAKGTVVRLATPLTRQ
jgi:signal transduction histidine kinase